MVSWMPQGSISTFGGCCKTTTVRSNPLPCERYQVASFVVLRWSSFKASCSKGRRNRQFPNYARVFLPRFSRTRSRCTKRQLKRAAHRLDGWNSALQSPWKSCSNNHKTKISWLHAFFLQWPTRLTKGLQQLFMNQNKNPTLKERNDLDDRSRLWPLHRKLPHFRGAIRCAKYYNLRMRRWCPIERPTPVHQPKISSITPADFYQPFRRCDEPRKHPSNFERTLAVRQSSSPPKIKSHWNKNLRTTNKNSIAHSRSMNSVIHVACFFGYRKSQDDLLLLSELQDVIAAVGFVR